MQSLYGLIFSIEVFPMEPNKILATHTQVHMQSIGRSRIPSAAPSKTPTHHQHPIHPFLLYRIWQKCLRIAGVGSDLDCHTITAMLRLVKIFDIDSKERIWEDARNGWIRETNIHDNCGEKGESDTPAIVTAANIGVLGPDDIVVVTIPISHVLLDDLWGNNLSMKRR